MSKDERTLEPPEPVTREDEVDSLEGDWRFWLDEGGEG